MLSTKQNILLIPMVLASPVGVIISVISGIKIVYMQTSKINNTDFDFISTIMNIFQSWTRWSFICLTIASILIIFYLILKFKLLSKHLQDEINLFSSPVLTVIIILAAQSVLPILSAVLMLAFAILYLFLVISLTAQNMLRFIVQVFIWILQSLFLTIGIDIELGTIIGQEYISIFLTLIIFLISVPYLFSGTLHIIKQILLKITGANTIINMTFKPFEFLFKLIHIRYFMYLVLFLLSILTYSYNVNDTANLLMLIKESLLAFVLLDTICYSVYGSHCKRKRLKYLKIYLNLIVPYKHDLEYIRSVMSTYVLKNNHAGKAKIMFSSDISILKTKKKLPFYDIILQIKDLNGNLMTYEDLYIKINKTLFCIYKYEYTANQNQKY